MSDAFKIVQVRHDAGIVWELHAWDETARRGFFNRRIGNWVLRGTFGSYVEAHVRMQLLVKKPFVVGARYFDKHGQEETD